MASPNTRDQYDQEPPLPQILGYKIPENIAEKAGPFLLGMVTTYLLQAVMPVVLYYTSITAQFLRVAFIWIVAAITICWYTGIGVSQANTIQRSISQAMAQFSSPSETTVSSPNRQFHLQSAETRAVRTTGVLSPIRAAISKDEIPVLAIRQTPELTMLRSPEKEERKASPTINVRPFLAPIRDDTRRTKSELQIPQKPVFNPRPVPERRSPESLSSRKIAYPQKSHLDQEIPLKPLQPEIPTQSQLQELELQKEELETMHSRRIAHPRRPTRQSSYGSTGKSTIASRDSRRNSTDSVGSLQNSKILNKPLPRVVDKPQYHHQQQGHGYGEHLARSNSVVSKQSVLGTRANYSKFLANVED